MSYEYSVETINLTKHYYLGGSVIKAVENVSLQIYKSEYLSLLGPSGSGKTTLFKLIGGLDKPTSGQVFVENIDISKLDAYELAWLRCKKIGYIFQTFNLIPILTALENVSLPMVFAGTPALERINKAILLLEKVGLSDRLHHKPYELSGGQQQRVAIARAMANDPSIILADEPTGNLDLKTGLEITSLLRRLNRENNITIFCATHDFKIIEISDRIVWIRDGKIEKIDVRSYLA
ncbi:MAG: ABC transporter ATP-binding protein [Candidatus Methanomethylicia archaeon]|nr:ABC transporter ATP-binding protein [Candidatus Methanomethylicia archaeon]MCX8169127.1 ABC transporter ATP-binding protein [Candidatus Methanomethylicia archaeon]MDW7988859.1 ABC transporter ATP-binding protein [Nitrososphaerota archaeon]